VGLSQFNFPTDPDLQQSAYAAFIASGGRPDPWDIYFPNSSRPQTPEQALPYIMKIWGRGPEARAYAIGMQKQFNIPQAVIDEEIRKAEIWVAEHAQRASFGDFLLQGTKIVGAAVGLVFLGGTVASAIAGGGSAAATTAASAAGASSTGASAATAAAAKAAASAAAGAAGAGASAGITATTLTTAISGGAGLLTQSGILERARAIAPKIIEGVNTGRTMNAIVKGEVPPPPISLEGDNFREWATSLGMSILESEMQGQMTDLQRKQAEKIMADQVALMQADTLARYGPTGILGDSPYITNPDVLAVMDAERARQNQMNKVLIFGGLGLGAVLLVMQMR
jgi:hypothetical protein